MRQIGISLLILGLCWGCSWLNSPLAPVTSLPSVSSSAPSPTPTFTPAPSAPACGFRDLGALGCADLGGANYAVLRSAADWAAYKAAAFCNSAPLSLLDGFDFSVEMVLVIQRANSATCSASIDSVCVDSTMVKVSSTLGCGDALTPYYCGCYSQAVAIPASSLPVEWTNCSLGGMPGPFGPNPPNCVTSNL